MELCYVAWATGEIKVKTAVGASLWSQGNSITWDANTSDQPAGVWFQNLLLIQLLTHSERQQVMAQAHGSLPSMWETHTDFYVAQPWN